MIIITLLIGILVYLLILTLFVVKLHNKIYEIPHINNVINEIPESTQETTQEEVIKIIADSSINELPVKLGLDDLSQLLEDEIRQQSHEEIEKWAKLDEARAEQIRLKNLNNDYKEY